MAETTETREIRMSGWIVVETAEMPDTGDIAHWTVGATIFATRNEAQALADKIKDDDTAPLVCTITVEPVGGHAEFAHWSPTADNINALPDSIRRYIHDLATRCDPAGDIRTAAVLRDTAATLAARITELEAENARLREASEPEPFPYCPSCACQSCYEISKRENEL